eukprot:scaffold6240_cov45-Isochrysis_galbana.AAC.1
MAAQDEETGTSYDEFGAGGGEAGEPAAEGVSLAAAKAEARRWRERAEELEFLKDVVVVRTSVVRTSAVDPTDAASARCVSGQSVPPDSCQNGLPAA